MADDYTELIEYLDEKFQSVNSKLDDLAKNKAEKADVDALMGSL